MNKSLQNSILNTLYYFDIFSFPLTKEELYRFLWRPQYINYYDFLEFLNSEKISGVDKSEGYYYLSGHHENISARKMGLIYSETRLNKARRAIRLLRWIPFLKAVFVCNTVASGTAHNQSDIDLFIVSAPKRVWIVRLFANLVLRLFGLRTFKENISNKICLSFFVDEKHLDLAPWRVENDDIHFAYWIYQMVPIFDPENIYEKFLRLNQWIKPYLPFAYERRDYEYIKNISLGRVVKAGRWFFEVAWSGWYGDRIETQAKEVQKKHLKQSVIRKANTGDHGVVLGDGIIKLHENDTRKLYLDKWKASINNINV